MYANKIGIYQGDCAVYLGRNIIFSDYIKEFSHNVNGYGLDCGAGPNGVNGKFFKHCILDGCDLEKEVVESLGEEYSKKFQFHLGKDSFSYPNETFDFIICSCVIQHLNNKNELKFAISELCRILKPNGLFYLMFKIGTNDTLLTHFNNYYSEERTFRVFTPQFLKDIVNLSIIQEDLLLDENYIPYCMLIFSKK